VLPAAARPVRLRDDGFDGNAGFSGKPPERGYGPNSRRATKKTMRMAGTPRYGLPLAGLSAICGCGV